MNTNYAFLFSLFLAASFFTGCTDGNQAKLDLLAGKWELSSADRAGKSMDIFLQGTYFEFKEGQKFESNFPYNPGVETPYTVAFQLEEEKIVSDELGTLYYNIDVLEEGKLQLSCVLNNAPYTLVFKK